MTKLEGTWTQIPADETHWQCEYGLDDWDLNCGTCNESSDKSYRSSARGRDRQNRAHWRNIHSNNYLCDFHYAQLTYRPAEAPPVEFLSADEFASGLGTN